MDRPVIVLQPDFFKKEPKIEDKPSIKQEDSEEEEEDIDDLIGDFTD